MFESSTFCYGFLRNVVEIVLLASQHPPLPRYFADHSQRSRAERLIAFVLCGMRSFVSHLVYCILPESVFFVAGSKVLCFNALSGTCLLWVFHKFLESNRRCR